MRLKTVNKRIGKQFFPFVAEFFKDDENLAEDVKATAFVAGGAIASLLHYRKINDLDIYFTDPDVLVRVCNYCLARIPGPKPGDVKNIGATVKRDGDDISIYIPSAGVEGGEDGRGDYTFFEQRPSGQADEFLDTITSGEDVDTMADLYGDELAAEINAPTVEHLTPAPSDARYKVLMVTANAISISNGIQIVVRFNGKPSEVVKEFDFEHTKAYWMPKHGLTIGKAALECLLTKELRYTGTRYPLCAMFRVRKFLHREWSITAGELLKIGFDISQLDLTNFETLKDQLVGVDTAYFSQLLSLISKDSKQGEIDRSYVVGLIDRIFN